MRALLSLILFTCFYNATAAQAQTSDVDIADYYSALYEANDRIKSSGNYMRTGNLVFAELELDEAQTKWSALVDSYSGKAVGPYTADNLDAALKAVEAQLRTVRTLYTDGQMDEAHAAILEIRSTLHALNQAAGVSRTSDYIFNASGKMAALWVYRHQTPDWADDTQMDNIHQTTSDFQTLIEAINSSVDDTTGKDPEFRRIIDGMAGSLELMHKAIDDHDPVLMINLLRELRSFDRILYLRYG